MHTPQRAGIPVGLTPVDWAFLIMKALMTFLWCAPIIGARLTGPNIPASLALLWVWFGFSLIGFLVSAAGLVLGSRKYLVRRRGLRLELIGISLMLGGPLIYLGIQIGIWAATGHNRLVVCIFLLIMMTALIGRWLMVWHEAKKTTVPYRFPAEDEEDEA